jgi:hypothetical protein
MTRDWISKVDIVLAPWLICTVLKRIFVWRIFLKEKKTVYEVGHPLATQVVV